MKTDRRKRFIAIDGNSLLYRAFFAMRYLSTTGGQPTNAIYGLTVMILKILEEAPDYIAAAFDTPEPTFRHQQYEAYKAQRKPTPEDLIAQAPLARELLRAFNIPVIEAPGFEADDIIGAMAKAAESEDVETVILTGDLDALQLVDDHTKVMTTVKGVSDTVVYDHDAVVQRFGLTPSQITDLKGLKGDSSDNIPGVPGIGDKTAADLLKHYGTLENLLAHLDDLPEGRVKKTLRENRELAVLSKHLATIVTDLPVEIDIHKYGLREPDYDALRDMFVRLEFRTMLQRLPQVEQAVGKAAVEADARPGSYRQISSDSEFEALLKLLESAPEISVHCHTTSEKSIRADLTGIGFCTERGETIYVPISEPVQSGSLELAFESGYRADIARLAVVLASDKPAKFCHDCKRNYSALALRGVELGGVVFDTMLAAYVLDASRSDFDIGTVAFEQLALELPGVTRKIADADVDEIARVCGEAEAIYRLKPVLEEKLDQNQLKGLLTDVEIPIAPILSKMELVGVKVDVGQLESLSKKLDLEVREVERSIFDLAGEEFNIGSPKQLQTILFEKLGLAASKKTKTGFSTSASALEELSVDYPIVAEILRYRELTKLKSTYADALPKLINPATGRIHTSLNQAVATTGRLSSSDPNLQNIPIKTELGREIRKAFVASGDNVLLSADYSQIELRILAEYTADPNLISAFEADEDIHLAAACAIFGASPSEVTSEMRRRAKTINFAVLYGMADFTLSKTLGIGVKEARDYIDTYFARFPGVKVYMEEVVAKARESGYVTTLLGRRRYLPDINSANYNTRMFAERAAINMPIQGTAADIIKLAMVHVDRHLRDTSARMLLQVHDELLFEVSADETDSVGRIVREDMEGAMKTRVRLKVDLKSGRNWSDMDAMSVI